MELQNPTQENCTTEFTPRNEENINTLEPSVKSVEEIRAELYAKIKIIADSYDILSMFTESLSRSGLTGNEKTTKLLYLALISRHSEDPISVIIKGESSAGKSYTADKVIEYFPAEAVEIITSGSDKALAYFDRPIKHRFLYFREASGITRTAEYFVRSIISEKRIDHLTVGSNGKGPELRRHYIEGPAGVIITTTKFLVNPENETRLLSVGVDMTEVHMKSIHMKQAEEFKVGTPLSIVNIAEIETWKAFNAWIALGSHVVTIPFADVIFAQIPPIAARLSRDIKKLGEMIKAHALIHQQNRSKTPDGKIVADIRDYEPVYNLSADWFAEGVDLSIPEDIRKVVEAVDTLHTRGAHKITQSDISKISGIGKSGVSRAVNKALDSGYLLDQSTKQRGSKAQLVIGEPLPNNESLLPHPDKVRELMGLTAQKHTQVIVGPGGYPLDWDEDFYNERVGMRIHDGGMSENEAEKAAFNDVVRFIENHLGAKVVSAHKRNDNNNIEFESEGNRDDF